MPSSYGARRRCAAGPTLAGTRVEPVPIATSTGLSLGHILATPEPGRWPYEVPSTGTGTERTSNPTARQAFPQHPPARMPGQGPYPGTLFRVA